MDELIEPIKQKTGLPADKAQGAAGGRPRVHQEQAPTPIASRIDGFLGGKAENIDDAVGDAANKLKEMFRK